LGNRSFLQEATEGTEAEEKRNTVKSKKLKPGNGEADRRAGLSRPTSKTLKPEVLRAAKPGRLRRNGNGKRNGTTDEAKS
jgi:hypothetical protein